MLLIPDFWTVPVEIIECVVEVVVVALGC
jgi:hypothetical protein